MPNQLAEAFALAAKVRPRIAEIDGSRLHFTCGGWWHGDTAGVPDAIVDALILAACVRELPGWTHVQNDGGGFSVYRPEHPDHNTADTLTLAYLAAVAAQEPRP